MVRDTELILGADESFGYGTHQPHSLFSMIYRVRSVTVCRILICVAGHIIVLRGGVGLCL